jgi:hypothetical protein
MKAVACAKGYCTLEGEVVALFKGLDLGGRVRVGTCNRLRKCLWYAQNHFHMYVFLKQSECSELDTFT